MVGQDATDFGRAVGGGADIGFAGDAGDVGGEDQVGCVEQGTADGGFLFEDIDGGSGDRAIGQGVGHGVFVDDRPTACVDEDCVGSHAGQAIPVDEMTGFGGERRVQGDDV